MWATVGSTLIAMHGLDWTRDSELSGIGDSVISDLGVWSEPGLDLSMVLDRQHV